MKFTKKLFILFFISMAGITITTGENQQTIHPGKAVYNNNCLTCHQSDGSGVPGMNPPLSKISYVTGDKKKLITIILKGLTTPLEIDGEVYHNPMPAHSHLTDKEIADVLTYIRTSFGNKASAVTIEEVKKVRGSIK